MLAVRQSMTLAEAGHSQPFECSEAGFETNVQTVCRTCHFTVGRPACCACISKNLPFIIWSSSFGSPYLEDLPRSTLSFCYISTDTMSSVVSMKAARSIHSWVSRSNMVRIGFTTTSVFNLQRRGFASCGNKLAAWGFIGLGQMGELCGCETVYSQ